MDLGSFVLGFFVGAAMIFVVLAMFTVGRAEP